MANLSHFPATQKSPNQVSVPSLFPPVERIPLFGHTIPAGFPSPADDYVEAYLDLNKLLIKKKSATFFLRVKGDSMINAGIYPGDLVLVDRSIEPVDGSVVVAEFDREFTVKRLVWCNGMAELHAENPKYAPIKFKEGQELMILGVVTSSVHTVM